MNLFCRLFGGIFAGVGLLILIIFASVAGSIDMQWNTAAIFSMLPMLIFPLIFTTVGLTVFFAPTRRKKRLEKLMRDGDRLTATITEVSQTSDVRINNVRQWRFYASAMDPVLGEMRMFHSKDYRCDPTSLLLQTEVDVYVDPVHRNRYAMDESSAMR